MVYGLAYVVSLLPLRALYIISDCVMYPLMRYVLRYRLALVRRNIAVSFPDKDERWVKKTANQFYHYLCDELLEGLKLLTFSREEMMRHFRIENPEVMQQYIDRGQSVAIFLGHYGNWEWVTSIPLWVKGDYIPAQVYHAIENKAVNDLFLKMRARWGGDNVERDQTLRRLVRYRATGRPWMMGFISDQVPRWEGIHHWITFLNHPDTPVFTGGERLARKFGAAAVFIDIRREKRGYYVARIIPLSDDCSKVAEHEVTDKFFALFEENIRRQPHLWLWSHNRWKRTKEGFKNRFGDQKTIEE